MDKLPIYFAPLQGYTESPYRRAHRVVCGGVDAYYTPFIRLENGQARQRDLRDADVDAVPQIIAKNREEFLLLAKTMIKAGYREIDFNMGCPFVKQVQAGRGSGLLSCPQKVREILAEMSCLHDETGVDFSIKMRLGQDSAAEGLAVWPQINRSVVKHIVLHPRLGRQQYTGVVDKEAFSEFYRRSEKPLIYNGEIKAVADIEEITELYPRLKALMLGRGLLARPTLAAEYRSGRQLRTEEVQENVMRLHRELFRLYCRTISGGTAQLLQKLRPFWEYLEPLFGRKFIKNINKARSLAEYCAVTGCHDAMRS